uniref:Uncharacterized protein n=1 Tax=Panagrolaimus sp. PS1159 TaxID=55785 RepID=A0AC35EV44_9BILA
MLENTEPFELILSETSSESESEDKNAVNANVETVEQQPDNSFQKNATFDDESLLLSSPENSDISSTFIPSNSITLQEENENYQLNSSSFKKSINPKRRRRDISLSSSSSDALSSSSPCVSDPSAEDDDIDILAHVMIPRNQQSLNMQEIKDLIDENNKSRLYYDEQIFRYETIILQNAHEIKKFGEERRKDKKKKKKKNLEEEPPFEIKESDRIFSGTSASFKPDFVFESDNEDIKHVEP